ncbi:MarR family winged helix-turn-helix transcriptional regulator [Streptacidiphilus monticola]|uniref:MarR family winged helix-turn-helix transcriptional regulator n=1 Tax=Streptacidiphilus monticola TaxID=2161674 RepID=A0ABW1G2H8_9ACTN
MAAAQEHVIDSPGAAVADPRIRAFGVLLTTASLMERLLGATMERESGISHAMFEVLLHLQAAPEEGAMMSDLSRSLVLTSGGATRLVDRMVEAGLVSRSRSSQDKRVQLVSLTDAGREKLTEAAARHAAQLDAHLYDVLPPGERDTMLQGLDDLGRHVREVLPPLG